MITTVQMPTLTLQRKAVRRFALNIATTSDETTGHLALELVRTCKERGMRTTIASRNAKPRRVAENDVSAPFTRRLEHRKRQEVRSAHDQGASRVDGFRQAGEILDCSIHIRVLNEHTAEILAECLVAQVL